MSTYPIYKFDLRIGNTTRRAYPVYKNDLSKNYEKESNQQFFRAKLSGKLSFQGKDYTRIDSAAFDTEFFVTVYASVDDGETWSVYWEGSFWKTDCEFNQDDKTVSVTPNVIDRYSTILAGIEHEYNLIDLLPEMSPVSMDKRPMVQVYIPGESVISCFLSGMWWEEECESVDEYVEEGGQMVNKLTTHYYFLLNVREKIISVEGSYEGLPDVFYGRSPDTPWTTPRTYVNGDYAFVYRSVAGSGYITYYWEIARSSDNVVMWRYSMNFNSGSSDEPWGADFYVLSPVEGTGAYGDVTIRWRDVAFYTRLITDVPRINGTSLLELPSDDLAANHNYKYVFPYGRTDIIYFSGTLSSAPTKWGVYDIGQYYVPPTVYLNPEVYPIARNLWGRISYWFAPYRFNEADEEAGRKPIKIKDAYKLSSAISVLLRTIDPNSGISIPENQHTKYNTYIDGTTWGSALTDVYCELIPLQAGKTYHITFRGSYGGYSVVLDSIPTTGQPVSFAPGYTGQINTTGGQTVIVEGASGQYLYVRADNNPGGRIYPTIKTGAIRHEDTIEFSQFLYGENPITHIEQNLLIAPKSNIRSSNYDQPAQKATVTLKAILDMLRDCFRCYWFIDDDGRFRIEHISYFMNGGTYTGDPVVGIDLTTLRSRRSEKEWSFAKNKFKYDKPETAARYQFSWMDDQTELFNGYPIDIVSGFVEKDKTEEIRVSQFSSDVDFILLNPGVISADGFVLMAAYYEGGTPSQTETILWGSPQIANNNRYYRYLSERVQEGDVLDFSLWNYTDYECGLLIMTRGVWGEGEVVSDTGWQSQDIHKVVDSIEGGYFCRIVVRKKDNSNLDIYEGNGVVNILNAQRYEEGTPATFRLPYIDYYYNNTSHKLQNAWVCFNYLQQYYAYDMPAPSYKINGVSKTALGTKRLKAQEISFPLLSEPELNKLIKTEIGYGVIEKLSINLSSRNAKATLIYDTE